jgi:hypothetical protein
LRRGPAGRSRVVQKVVGPTPLAQKVIVRRAVEPLTQADRIWATLQDQVSQARGLSLTILATVQKVRPCPKPVATERQPVTEASAEDAGDAVADDAVAAVEVKATATPLRKMEQWVLAARDLRAMALGGIPTHMAHQVPTTMVPITTATAVTIAMLALDAATAAQSVTKGVGVTATKAAATRVGMRDR